MSFVLRKLDPINIRRFPGICVSGLASPQRDERFCTFRESGSTPESGAIPVRSRDRLRFNYIELAASVGISKR
jgi:hypothetical protein